MGSAEKLKGLGLNFKALRILHGLTQERAAEKTGFSRNFIIKLERGGGATAENIFKIAEAFKVRPETLLMNLEETNIQNRVKFFAEQIP